MHSQIRPVPPYDFTLSAAIFSPGDPRVRIFRDGILFQPVSAGNQAFLVEITGSGSIGKPVLHLRIQSGESASIPRSEAAEVRRVVGHILNADLDLRNFYRDVSSDPVLSRIVTSLVGLKPPRTLTIFEALVESILEQQIAIQVARRLVQQIIRKFGREVTVGSDIFFLFPEPEVLAKASDEEYRACGMSVRKGEYIRDIATRIIEGSLDLNRYLVFHDPVRIIDELCELRGVGKWTAEFTVLRSLGQMGTFPADDLGIRRVIGKYYRHGQIIDSREARKIAELWGPWKGLAAFYLLTAESRNIPQVSRVLSFPG
ncbi:MAG: hypothetical protein ABFC24_01850 [Methanoregulaceae archaeon]